MKRLLMVFSVLLALSLVTAGVAFGANSLIQESGLNYIDPDRVQDGYPLFYYGYDGGSVVMIDLYGNLIHHWSSSTLADYSITSLCWSMIWDNGELLTDASHTSTGGSAVVSDGVVRGARQYDSVVQIGWNGNLVAASGDSLFAVNYAPHHDWKKIYNKALGDYTWLALTWQGYYPEDAIALGCDEAIAPEGKWSPDGLIEVTMDGDLAWRWSFADHLVQNYDATKTAPFIDGFGYENPGATFGEPADFPGKLNINHINDNGKGPERDWNHCNSMDYNPALGYVVLNAKDFSEIYVVDHDSTFVSTEDFTQNWAAARGDAGDFLYRFGNPDNYDQGEPAGYNDAGSHQFFGAHNIHWIGESQGSMYRGYGDVPGTGNMLIFDNNCWDPTEHASNVLEWNPYIMDPDGNLSDSYVNPPDAGYHAGTIQNGGFGSANITSVRGYSSQAVWRFNGGTGFYGYHISGMQRMPNGNTHVCEGTQSHIFEVTTGGVVTWEYYKPNTAGGFGGGNPFYYGGSTFRSNKVPADHPAIADKTLTPQGNFRQIILEGDTPSPALELAKFLGTM